MEKSKKLTWIDELKLCEAYKKEGSLGQGEDKF